MQPFCFCTATERAEMYVGESVRIIKATLCSMPRDPQDAVDSLPAASCACAGAVGAYSCVTSLRHGHVTASPKITPSLQHTMRMIRRLRIGRAAWKRYDSTSSARQQREAPIIRPHDGAISAGL